MITEGTAGSTIGEAVGDELDRVCGGVEAPVTEIDLFEVCHRLKTSGKDKMVSTTVVKLLGWTKKRATAAFDRLYALNILSEMYGQGARYSINPERLDEFLESHKDLEAKLAEAAPKSEQSEEDDSRSARIKLSAPLQGIQGKPKLSKYAAKKASAAMSLDDILADIRAMPKKQCFEGVERDAKIEETLGRAIDVIVRFNEGLNALEKVCDVQFGNTPAEVHRLEPCASIPNGGFSISYRPRNTRDKCSLNVTIEWPTDLTQNWCDRKIARIEAWATKSLSSKAWFARNSSAGVRH